MDRPALSLEPLTLPDVGARELIDIADQTGFAATSLILNSPSTTMPADPIVVDLELRTAALDRLKQARINILNIECFNLCTDADPKSFHAGLACGFEFGARTASTIVWENGDRSDVLAKLARLCDMAREFGIRINLEFMALSKSMNSLDVALDLVRDCRRKNIGLMVDILHLMRTGGTIDRLREVDPELIGGAQLCDGPLSVTEGDMLAEAGGNRLVPGQGEFPVREFIDALPQELIIGVEAPQVSLVGRMPPLERARQLMLAVQPLVGARIGA
jgi:sugar phosphate isomerase/epimerase